MAVFFFMSIVLAAEYELRMLLKKVYERSKDYLRFHCSNSMQSVMESRADCLGGNSRGKMRALLPKLRNSGCLWTFLVSKDFWETPVSFSKIDTGGNLRDPLFL